MHPTQCPTCGKKLSAIVTINVHYDINPDGTLGEAQPETSIDDWTENGASLTTNDGLHGAVIGYSCPDDHWFDDDDERLTTQEEKIHPTPSGRQ